MTDGGLETTLVFHHGIDLPCFATLPLLQSEEHRNLLAKYFRSYAEIANQNGMGFILDTLTWRGSRDWGTQLGFDDEELRKLNRDSVEFARGLMTGAENVVLNGVVGPRGDGYSVDQKMSEEEAEQYHRAQIEVLAQAGVEMITVLTMNYPEEAIGVARAAVSSGVPVIVSFTVETDGRLPSGELLESAISRVDEATGFAPLFYMVNCAHPSHFSHLLDSGASWTFRLGGVRVNCSTKSHAELDESTELDIGDPLDLAERVCGLVPRLPNLRVVGGCCGTDTRHLRSIAERLNQ